VGGSVIPGEIRAFFFMRVVALRHYEMLDRG